MSKTMCMMRTKRQRSDKKRIEWMNPLSKLPTETKQKIYNMALAAIWLSTAPFWFWLADLERGYDGTGGELLLMAIPFLARALWIGIRDWGWE